MQHELGREQVRLLTQTEVDRLTVLSRNGVGFGLLELTATGLQKNILDAVEDFRRFLLDQAIHDYSIQAKGPHGKRVIEAAVLTPDNSFVGAAASLYRPETKNGDPRIWFSRLNNHAAPGDVLAVAAYANQLFVFNISKVDLVVLERGGGAFGKFLTPFFIAKVSVVEELRGALEVIGAKGFIRSEGSADTTVGMLLEAELGIKANSSRAPDYKGIEIKSARSGRGNRHNLFARVPDWERSVLKSSQAILDTFGYEKEGRQQLYCTVAAGASNPQGLALLVDEKKNLLWETSTLPELPLVVSWTMESLETALADKHAETFWVSALARKSGAAEEFHFVSVEHTANPIVEQLAPLITSRHVTMDHLVREKDGRAAERGPIFKLRHGALSLLFPPSFHYPLV